MSKKKILVLLCAVLCLSLVATVVLAACNQTYTVTYESGNSAVTGTAPTSETYKEGDTVTVANNTFVLDNYTFNGWSDGTTSYKEGDTFTMPANNVTLTAQWTPKSVNPEPGNQEEDKPTLSELDSKFYNHKNWEYMTNKNGSETDGGDKVYALNDGSVKFHRENQAIDLGAKLTKASFMLKATNDFALWFNSSSKDNTGNYSYRLVYGYDQLRLVVSSSPEQAAAVVTSTYKKAEWNRIDIELTESQDESKGVTVCAIKLYVNGERATLSAGENTAQITVADNVMTHTQMSNFKTGTYMVAKCWEADNYFQIKPVAKADEKDVPIVAAIGASITEGAGAGNFYTESYPAQLQNALGGDYNVINFGKSGRTVRTDTGKDDDGTPVPWLENRQWGGVQSIVPDIAIINMGTNDSKTSLDPVSTHDSFKAAYDHLLDELLKVNKDMRIIICTVPTAYSSIYNISEDNIRDIIAPVQREIAEERDMDLVDLYKITQNKSLLFGDGVHPGTRGYAMFAEVLKKAVLEGADALTTEFLANIDDRYNDPEYEIKDIHAEIAVDDDQVKLTLTGNIVIEDESGLKLSLDTGNADQQKREVAIDPDENGDFSVTVRIDDLTGTSWYNIRLYITDTYNRTIKLSESDLTKDREFKTSSRKVTIKSWTDIGGDTLSFSTADYDSTLPTVEATEVKFENGNLVFSGKVSGNRETVESLVVYLFNATEGTENFKATATIGEDGTFTVRIGLAQLTIADNEWYYLWTSINGGAKQKVAYTEYNKEERYVWENRTYRWQYYEGIAIAYTTKTVSSFELELTTATVTEQDGKAILTLAGTTTDTALRLYIGNAEATADYYHAVTVTDGNFTTMFDLLTLAIGGGWYNVRLYYTDDTYYTITYPEVTFNDGALTTGTVFYGTDRKVTVQTWGDDKPLSLNVEQFDSSYTITATKVEFKDGKLQVSGTATGNITSLVISLHNDNLADHPQNLKVTVESGDYASFTVSFDLTTLTESNGTWYYLWSSVNGGEDEKVLYDDYDSELRYDYNGRRYRFENWNKTGIAIAYENTPAQPTFTLTLTSVKVEATDGKIMLTLVGTTTDTALKFFIGSKSLAEMESSSEYNHAEDVTIGAEGVFTHTFDLATCPVGGWYNIRFYYSDGEYYAVSYEEAVNAEGTTLKVGDSFVGTNTKVTVRSWDDKGNTVKTFSIQVESYTAPQPTDPSISVTDMRFENGKFVVDGTCNDAVTKLTFHLNNTTGKQMDIAKDATITEGHFKVEYNLDEIKDKYDGDSIKEYINVRYTFNGEESSYKNLLPTTDGEYAVGQEYRYGEKTWLLKADTSRTYLNWSANTDAYRLTSVKLELLSGVPTFTLEGTLTGDKAEFAINQIHLKLDKTQPSGSTDVKWVSNTATEAGHFKFQIELSSLVASVNSNTPSAQQAYFIRLYTGESADDSSTKLADVNSRYASDLLWERGQIETNDGIYFLMKNTEYSSTNWNTLGICKFDKQA